MSDEGKYLTVKEVATRLNIVTKTVGRKDKEGIFPNTIGEGRGKRFLEADVEAYEQKRVATKLSDKEEPKESEAVLKEKKTTALANAKKDRIIAEVEEAEAQKRKDAISVGMTVEQYRAAQENVIRQATEQKAKEVEWEEKEVALEKRRGELKEAAELVNQMQRDAQGLVEWFEQHQKKSQELISTLQSLNSIVKTYHPNFTLSSKYWDMVALEEKYQGLVANLNTSKILSSYQKAISPNR